MGIAVVQDNPRVDTEQPYITDHDSALVDRGRINFMNGDLLNGGTNTRRGWIATFAGWYPFATVPIHYTTSFLTFAIFHFNQQFSYPTIFSSFETPFQFPFLSYAYPTYRRRGPKFIPCQNLRPFFTQTPPSSPHAICKESLVIIGRRSRSKSFHLPYPATWGINKKPKEDMGGGKVNDRLWY